MKALVLTLLFCIGIYFLAKATLKPTVKEVETNTSNLNCTPPSAAIDTSNHHKNNYIILDRTSVILKQNNKLETHH